MTRSRNLVFLLSSVVAVAAPSLAYADIGEVDKALTILKLSFECPLPPCDYKCGVSTGYTKQVFSGDQKTFRLDEAHHWVKGLGSTVTVVPWRLIDVGHLLETMELKCLRGACIRQDYTRPDETMPTEQLSTITLQFCDDDAKQRARLALEVLLSPAVQQSSAAAPGWCDEVDPKTPAETAICDHADLGALDQDLAQRYASVKNSTGVREAQRRWLKVREDCGADRVCLKSAYEERLRALGRAQ